MLLLLIIYISIVIIVINISILFYCMTETKYNNLPNC